VGLITFYEEAFTGHVFDLQGYEIANIIYYSNGLQVWPINGGWGQPAPLAFYYQPALNLGGAVSLLNVGGADSLLNIGGAE
jgi:hypothetical protein